MGVLEDDFPFQFYRLFLDSILVFEGSFSTWYYFRLMYSPQNQHSPWNWAVPKGKWSSNHQFSGASVSYVSFREGKIWISWTSPLITVGLKSSFTYPGGTNSSMGLCLVVYLHPNLQQKFQQTSGFFPYQTNICLRKFQQNPSNIPHVPKKIQNMEGNFIISFHKQVVEGLVWHLPKNFLRHMILTIRSVPRLQFCWERPWAVAKSTPPHGACFAWHNSRDIPAPSRLVLVRGVVGGWWWVHGGEMGFSGEGWKRYEQKLRVT